MRRADDGLTVPMQLQMLPAEMLPLEQTGIAANGNVIRIEGIPLVASPLKLADSPVHYHRAPPHLGQHSQAIMQEAGLDYAHYAALGVVK
mgnify:CR=1 FL=1